jgi:hypothetical protein
MTPRLQSSKKWTALPKELSQQMIEVFQEGFKAPAKRGKFIVEGRIYPEELIFRAGYLETGRLVQANFEVSLDFDPKKQNAMEQIRFAMDVAASMMDEYFTEDNFSDFPLLWEKHEINKRVIYLKASSENSELEAKASALLGESNNDDLVQSDDSEELEKQVITMLGLNSDDDDEDPEDPIKH